MLHKLAQQAERYFAEDPSTALIKLRQFGEVLARQLAALTNTSLPPNATQVDVINALCHEGSLSNDAVNGFHALRKSGNKAPRPQRRACFGAARTDPGRARGDDRWSKRQEAQGSQVAYLLPTGGPPAGQFPVCLNSRRSGVAFQTTVPFDPTWAHFCLMAPQ